MFRTKEAEAARQAAARERRQRAGNCIRCGLLRDPESKQLCTLHLFKQRQQKRALLPAATKRRDRKYRNQQKDDAFILGQIDPLLAGLPDSVRLDARQDILIAVLSGDIPFPVTRERIKPWVRDVWKQNADHYRFVSLSSTVGSGDNAQTWAQLLGLESR